MPMAFGTLIIDVGSQTREVVDLVQRGSCEADLLLPGFDCSGHSELGAGARGSTGLAPGLGPSSDSTVKPGK